MIAASSQVLLQPKCKGKKKKGRKNKYIGAYHIFFQLRELKDKLF